MKTILYQPLFINPQAYFVFPQLYHIEKGDSYIEPANITGQLIINNLSEGLTLTPTVNVIQDSNQIDFSYLREIPQYGEWIIGDMVVVDGNTYAYNGKLWLDASGTPSSVARSGATGERPQNVLAGFCYFDKTINKPVWWNGSSWTDASGTTM